MNQLVVCASCRRHVRAATACPFCARSRGVIVVAVAAAATLVGCAGSRERETVDLFGDDAGTPTPAVETADAGAPEAAPAEDRPADIYGGPPIDDPPPPQIGPAPSSKPR